MSNIASYNSVKADSNNSLKPVKNSVIKTHCIVCNSAFLKPRAGKLYCSNSCKQFGYNHKELKTAAMIPTLERKNRAIQKFSLKDYARYIEMNADLKRYKELLKRNERFQEQERTMLLKSQMGIEIKQDYVFTHYLLQLNEAEFYDFQDLEFHFLDLRNSDPPYLSLEQWCFIKKLFNKLDDWEFLALTCQLSKDYIQQLNLRPFDPQASNELSIMKKRYVNHCNDITEGVIRFV